jgi:hypothetical protein
VSAIAVPLRARERLELGWFALPAGAAALLGIARLLPETGFGLWFRLATATLVVILPGRFVARCLGQRTAAAASAWSVALVGFGLALTFALGASLDLTLAFVLAAGAVALGTLVAGSHLEGSSLPGRARLVRGLLAVIGLGFGAAVWFVQGTLTGDSLFHLGRIRKLDALGSLSLHDVGEFPHGGLHPGYAFPLWHGWLALVARLADVDPTKVALHESSLLVPLALVLAFEMGWAVFRSTGIAIAVVLAQVAIKSLAPGHAGVYAFLWQPGTASTQLFAPLAVVLFFGFVRDPSWAAAATLAVGSASLALVHPTYALFLAIPLAGFAVALALLSGGGDLRRAVGALVAFGLPMAFAYAWLHPIVAQTVAVNLGPKQLADSLHHYRSDLVVQSLTRYSLAPARVDRSGSVVVAALVLTPLAVLARRRRWSALVLGGTVAVLAIELWPLVFPHFSNLVSISQSRRAAAFVPFAVAFAGGIAVLAGFSRLLTLVLALGCGIWLQLTYGGDFGLRAPRTEPALAVWIALYGAAAALAIGAVLAWTHRDSLLHAGRVRGLTAAAAAFLFVLPVAVHGFSHWAPKNSGDAEALTPGLIRFLQADVPPRSVVFGDLGTSYRAVAYAPVYAIAVPPSHAANTKPNQVFKRKRAWLKFLRDPSLYVPLRWRANWLVLRKSEHPDAIEQQGLKPVYTDKRFVVFRLPSVPLPSTQ